MRIRIKYTRKPDKMDTKALKVADFAVQENIERKSAKIQNAHLEKLQGINPKRVLNNTKGKVISTLNVFNFSRYESHITSCGDSTKQSQYFIILLTVTLQFIKGSLRRKHSRTFENILVFSRTSGSLSVATKETRLVIYWRWTSDERRR